MAILRLGYAFWRSLSSQQQSILLEKYEVRTISDAHWKERMKENATVKK